MVRRDAEPRTERGRHLLRSMRIMYPDERAEEWRNEILAIESEAVRLALEAAQEHLACACGGIEGHLRVRGLSAEAATEHRATLDVELVRRALLRVGAGWYDSDLTETARVFAAEYARLHEGDSQ